MSETHMDIIRRRTDALRSDHRGHTRRHKLYLLTILPFLGLIYRTSGLRKVHLLHRAVLCALAFATNAGTSILYADTSGDEPQSVYFFRERFSYVYVFLCANSQRVAATLKTSIPLQWCVQTFVKHHVCVCCFLFRVHPSILPPHDPSLVFPPAYMLLKRLNN